ncbi:MAG: hypothetical protein RBT66_09740 [bacterium]|jgi:hypothetical protein|nr:hypothetical protein [bacterium]
MSYTDSEGKTILQAWGKFRGYCYEAVDVGDLLARDTSNNGWIPADQSDSEAAEAIALENGAAGDTIWMALAVVLEAAPSESGGDWSAGTFCESTDVCLPLYVGESGKAQSSQGATCGQQVGFMLSTSTVLLCPGGYLTTTSLSLSGTLAVTGATTLTGALAANGGITIGSGKDLTLTAGDIVMTKGMIKPAVSDGATGSVTVATEYNVICVEAEANTTLTLPTAVAGLMYHIVHKSGDFTVAVTAGAGDKIIDPADGGVHDILTDDKGLDCHLTLVAVDDTNWVCTSINGDWTGSDS